MDDAVKLDIRRRNGMSPKNILKLDDHNEEQEMEFELDYLMSLSIRERFSLLEE